MWGQILNATIETIYMVGVALVLSALFGIPLGILLVITGPRHIKPLPLIHRTLSIVINVGRSLPFIILLVAIIPFTRWLVGTSDRYGRGDCPVDGKRDSFYGPGGGERPFGGGLGRD